jgi:hypothetical protein
MTYTRARRTATNPVLTEARQQEGVASGDKTDEEEEGEETEVA